jgi:hypothetical protein
VVTKNCSGYSSRLVHALTILVCVIEPRSLLDNLACESIYFSNLELYINLFVRPVSDLQTTLVFFLLVHRFIVTILGTVDLL